MTIASIEDNTLPHFPPGFVWGASTASYQIEGAVDQDGRGPSIWDVFARTPGRTRNGDTGDVACDHYHRSDEDVDWLARGGFGAYRFSIAWPRVQPNGNGAVNPKGLDFYDRLVDRLLARDIVPWVCLYHWDLPQALQERGGWLNRDVAQWFADYALAAADRLQDRVKHWITLNEPAVHAVLGHGLGIHAPGLTGPANLVAAIHHQNLAHGTALMALRQTHDRLRIGTVLNLQPVRPVGEREENLPAARLIDAVWNRACLDPLLKGRYPDLLAPLFAPVIRADDAAIIGRPLDFLGVNYYSRLYAVHNPQNPFGIAVGSAPPGTATTGMGWPIEPEGLFEQLAELRDNYGNPALYVTENGAAFDDEADADGRIRDHARIAFLRDHLHAALRAQQAGVALRGYFIWSLMDNFEWAEGMTSRFGLIHVDYATQKRTGKASFDWLAEMIRRGA